jgi:hypothetical protein
MSEVAKVTGCNNSLYQLELGSGSRRSRILPSTEVDLLSGDHKSKKKHNWVAET